MKLAVILISDPKSGSEESLARAFNAFSLAKDAKDRGDEVAVAFIGTGTRWPKVLGELGHPAHELYQSVRDVIRGAACGRADAFGARAEVEACGLPVLKEKEAVNGLSLRSLIAEGYTVQLF